MSKLTEIQDYAKFVTDRNSMRASEQRTDREFIEDKFALTLVKNKKYIIRTAFASDMMNSITTQMIGNNPRCFTEPKSRTNDKIMEASDRVAKWGNEELRKWQRLFRNPYRETFKHIGFSSGEGWLYMVHNETLAKWGHQTKGKTKEQLRFEKENDWRDVLPDALPVRPMIYDPLVVFTDPAEEINGRPTRVLISFEMSAGSLKAEYPYWKGDYKADSEMIPFRVYFDKSDCYAEAGKGEIGKGDAKPLFYEAKDKLSNGDGIRRNIYGEVPFIHVYSGLGLESYDKDPAKLAVSRIRLIRGLILEDNTMASDFQKNIHTNAAPHRTFFIPSDMEFDENVSLANYHPDDPDAVSFVRVPPGMTGDQTLQVEKGLVLPPEAFAYAAQVRGRLMAKHPAPLQGIASGTSGRQEDILSDAGLSIYDSPLDNNNVLWGEALSLAMRIATNPELDIKPKGLNKGDEDSYLELTVDTKKEDEVKTARKTAVVERQWQSGFITQVEALMQLGYTKDKAEHLADEAWVEMVMRNDPTIVQMVVQIMAQEMNEEDRLAQIQQAVRGAKPNINYGSQGGEPRTGNIQSAEGMEMADMGEVRPARMSPR